MKLDLLLNFNDRSASHRFRFIVFFLLLIPAAHRNHTVGTLLQSFDIEPSFLIVLVLLRFCFGSGGHSLAFLGLRDQLRRSARASQQTIQPEERSAYLLKTPFVLLPHAKHLPVFEYRLTAHAASK